MKRVFATIVGAAAFAVAVPVASAQTLAKRLIGTEGNYGEQLGLTKDLRPWRSPPPW